jgi:CRP-like cAMP-binding protein/class 3 adenylate cyclase
MAPSKAGGSVVMGDRWTAILRGGGPATMGPRLGRRAFGLFPGRPRCKFCNAPYGGWATLPFRILGYRPSDKTPHVCARCLEWAPEGGANVPLSILVADVRGYTRLTESAPDGQVSALLSRFYDVASRVLLRHEGVLGQVAGDHVIGLFVPGLSGQDYPQKAVAAAAALLAAVGYRTPEGPWIEIAIGISTGEGFCGNVGGGGFKDFTAVGEVPNTGARLTSRADVGEALVDLATRAGAPDYFFSDGDSITLGGRSAAIETYRLRLDMSTAGSAVEPVVELMNNALFAGLPPQLGKVLRQRVHRRAFATGAYLTRQGEPADSVFVIEHGLVRVARRSRQGRELVMALLGAGDMLGELGVLEADGSRTANALALEQTTCVTLARSDLEAVVRTTPELALRLLAALGSRVRHQDEELAQVAFLDVPGRLAHKLLELSAGHGEPVAGGVRIRVRLPQAELAAMVGSSREIVNRALRRFVALGAVSIEHGLITILDADRLRSLC